MSKARLLANLLAEDPPAQGRVRNLTVLTDSPIYRYNFWTDEEYYMRFSMEPDHVDFSKMLLGPVLKDHNRSVDNVIGTITSVRLDGALKATAKFSDAASVDDIWSKIQERTIRNVSVEAVVTKLEKQKEKFDGLPYYIATKWEPEAVALVAVGADRNAQIMGALDFEGPAAIRETLRGLVKEALEESGIVLELKSLREQLKLAANMRRTVRS